MSHDQGTLMSALTHLKTYHFNNPSCFTASDLNDLKTLERHVNQILGAAHRNELGDPKHHHSFDRARQLMKHLQFRQRTHAEKMGWEEELMWRHKYDPGQPRVPAGDSHGGRWTDEGGGSGSGASSGDKKPQSAHPPVPKYPGGKPPIDKHHWEEYHNNLSKGPKVSKTEQEIHAKIFAMEGGYKRDGKTYAGITPGALADAKRRPALRDKLKDIHTPADLDKNRDLIPYVYKDHIDHGLRRAGVSSPLDQVGNPYAAAALADTIFREGEGAGGKITKDAVLRTDPKLKNPLSDEDGILKRKTFAAYSKLAKNPATLRPLLDNVAEGRKSGRYGNEKNRIGYFQFKEEREK